MPDSGMLRTQSEVVKDVESQVQNASQCEESLSGEPSAQIVNLILSSQVSKWVKEPLPLM